MSEKAKAKVKKEKWLLEVTDTIRIEEQDSYGFVLLKLTEGFNNQTKKPTSNWNIIGYYGTVRGALEGILHKDLLVDLNLVSTIRGYQEETRKAYKFIQTQLDGSK